MNKDQPHGIRIGFMASREFWPKRAKNTILEDLKTFPLRNHVKLFCVKGATSMYSE